MDELLKSAAAFLDNDSLQVKFTRTTLISYEGNFVFESRFQLTFVLVR